MSMDDSEATGRLGGYADMILGIDDTVNPVGAECWMRLQYGTLDHLPRETFAAEAAMAKVGEELQPGSLREIAGTYGSAERYDIAQGIIDARAKARDEAAAGKRDGEAMKAAAEPRADGGTPPDRGGRMSRGRPAGDIIEREAREAGEEVDRELGRAREALAAAGVPCRDVVVEMAPHRNPPGERFIALAHGTGAGERVVAGGGETPRAAAGSVREHASAVAYSLGLGAGEGTRYAQPRTGPRPEQERPEQEAAVPAGTAADQPLRVWIGAIRVGENKPEEIDRFLLRRDADGNYVPEEMAPELTKRQVAYIANVHARERRPIPDLLTEAGQSEAWKFVREQAAARKSREEPPQPRVAPQPQTSPQPRPGPRLEQAAGKPALTAEVLEAKAKAKAKELRKGYREDVRSIEMHKGILNRARARKVWPESEEAVAKAGTRQAARRKEAAALGIELEPRRETRRGGPPQPYGGPPLAAMAANPASR